MNNVMTNGFCELNENEMMNTEGGFEFEFNWGPVKVSFGSSDVKAVYNWYVNTYVPAAMDFGGRVYDYLH